MGITKQEIKTQKQERLGTVKANNHGELMKCIAYNNSSDIVVEFQDEFKRTKKSTWREFKSGSIRNPHDYERIGINIINNHGDLARCINYNNPYSVTIEFQDEQKTQVTTSWDNFIKGIITNPNSPSVYGVGIVGSKYQVNRNGKTLKEYRTWMHMIERCYNNIYKEKHPTYKDVTCCDEWLYYPNFYEWLHSQENFDKFVLLERSAIDKDILIKGNKIYSPETCCLVPGDVNGLFIKQCSSRGKCPIGVRYDKRRHRYVVTCRTHNDKSSQFLGEYNTFEEAFETYKDYKENLIKRIAQEEYNKGNITKKCYEAMMNYEVEITD